MGLDTSHNAWHGPYSSFGQFRTDLAAHVGINLKEMEGYGGDTPFETIEDDVKILLDHSDCDGEITPEDCAKLAVRLRDIMKTLPEEPGDWNTYAHCERFAKGCELAASKNEPIDFH